MRIKGLVVTSSVITLEKNENNLIGISIGGGAPLCPCLYVVQIFDNTPAFADGSLESGDELLEINKEIIKGKSKSEVARMIQAAIGPVTIKFNKLKADSKKGRTLDFLLKKMKHKVVENMSSSTADALGLSRAILCNDTLIKKFDELNHLESLYKHLVEQIRRVLRSTFDLLQVFKEFGDIFSKMGVKELQQRASESFTKFGEAHRTLWKLGIQSLKTLKPILTDIGTFLHKAIPDIRLTIKKYADVKFEYLAYCLKVKEMDDEEYTYAHIQEPLYRVETGNYEYRLILRCRQEARKRFGNMRNDVLVKLELLESKHMQDIAKHLQHFISELGSYNKECLAVFEETRGLFPIELDLSAGAFTYESLEETLPPMTEDEVVPEEAKEITEESTLQTLLHGDSVASKATADSLLIQFD
ncbi:PRKCA-binding protein-like isoform X3 [Artemia franciscana]|uniref:PRKCA-binding protein-like isoform X3 n=1 Tax=Artemia franciscana TaxID=6661 RepID=UPI0032DA3344